MYSDFLWWFNLIMDWLGGVVKMGDAPSSCHFGTTLSRKLASASWSPSCISCFSKYGGSWNLTSHETPTLFLLFFGSYGRKIPCAQCWWKVGSVGLLLKKTPYLLWFNYPPSEPPPWLVHKQFGRGSIPHGDTIGMSPAAKTAASASASCFRAKLPAKLAFVPYPWASSSLTMR